MKLDLATGGPAVRAAEAQGDGHGNGGESGNNGRGNGNDDADFPGGRGRGHGAGNPLDDSPGARGGGGEHGRFGDVDMPYVVVPGRGPVPLSDLLGQVEPDLSPEEEQDAISRGWR